MAPLVQPQTFSLGVELEFLLLSTIPALRNAILQTQSASLLLTYVTSREST